jgi:large subunit ribosomal protein L22
MKIKAVLSKYRMSPKKIRPILSNLRGMSVSEAISVLNFLNRKAAEPIKKLIISAVSNAKNNNNLEEKDLYISEIFADEGKKLKRFRPRARGSAFMIRKRSSQVTVVLENKIVKKVKVDKPVEKVDKTINKKVEKVEKIEETKKSSNESKNIKQDNKS